MAEPLTSGPAEDAGATAGLRRIRRHITQSAHERIASRRRAWTALGVAFSLVIGLGIGAVSGALYLQYKLDRNIERFTIGEIPNRPTRPPKQPAEPGGEVVENKSVNILLLGSDSRISGGDPSQWQAGGQRTDAMMLLHIPSDRNGAYLMSIPRDSWVDIPGRNAAKINAAFSWGGPTLTIHTVENLTGVYIDHIVLTDFEAFSNMTNSLGGVEITLSQSWRGPGGRVFEPGTHRMNGEEALAYARTRYGLPGGDFDRVKRQQNWMRSMATAVFQQGILTNPVKLMDFLDVVTKSVSTDDDFTIEKMRNLALSLASLRPADVVFMTVPVAGTGWSPDGSRQSIVNLDRPAFDALMEAVAADDMAAYVEEHKDELNLLGTDVR